jgi:hypothetical protein
MVALLAARSDSPRLRQVAASAPGDRPPAVVHPVDGAQSRAAVPLARVVGARTARLKRRRSRLWHSLHRAQVRHRLRLGAAYLDEGAAVDASEPPPDSGMSPPLHLSLHPQRPRAPVRARSRSRCSRPLAEPLRCRRARARLPPCPPASAGSNGLRRPLGDPPPEHRSGERPDANQEHVGDREAPFHSGAVEDAPGHRR